MGDQLDKHLVHLSENLRKFYERGLWTDITIIVDDHVYRAHRLVLIACSSYFRRILTNDESNGNKSELVIKHVRPCIVKATLDLCYGLEVDDAYKVNIRNKNDLRLVLKITSQINIPRKVGTNISDHVCRKRNTFEAQKLFQREELIRNRLQANFIEVSMVVMEDMLAINPVYFEPEYDMYPKTQQDASKKIKRADEKYLGFRFECFRDLYIRHQLTDFTIIVEDHEFQVHKLILAACSEYFVAMLSHALKESRESRASIGDISADTMEAVLRFFYGFELNINRHNYGDLLRAASIFLLDDLRDCCIDFIKANINVDNCLDISIMSYWLYLHDLYADALELCLTNFKTIMHHQQFVDLPVSILSRILADDNLVASDESEVLRAISIWIESDELVRSSMLDILIEHVRFTLMDHLKLNDLRSCPLVQRSAKCRNLVEEAKDYLSLKFYDDISANLHSPLEAKSRIEARYSNYPIVAFHHDNGQIHTYNPITNSRSVVMSDRKIGRITTVLGEFIYAFRAEKSEINGRYHIKEKVWFYDVSDVDMEHETLGHDWPPYFVVSLYDRIYAINHKTIKTYDPAENVWSETAEISNCRVIAGVIVHRGRICILKENCIIDRYDPLSRKWTSSTTNLPLRGLYVSCCDRIFSIITDDWHPERSKVIYALEHGTNTKSQFSTSKLGSYSVVEYRDVIYIYNGHFVLCYNPVKNSWTEIAGLFISIT